MAKKNQAEVKITAKNQLKAGLHDAMDELGSFGKAVDHLGKLTIGAGLGLALYKVGEAAKACVDNFMETEDAYLRLARALGKEDYNKAIKSIDKFSKYTKASRDELVMMTSTMAAMGKSAEEMDKITTAAISLSNVTGKDLNSSFEIMLDSLNGSTGEMEKFLPQVKNMSAEIKAAGGAIDEVINKFGDLSTQSSEESFGQIRKNMTDSFDSIGESIGEILKYWLGDVFSWASQQLEDIEEYLKGLASEYKTIKTRTITPDTPTNVFARGWNTQEDIKNWSNEDLLEYYRKITTDKYTKNFDYKDRYDLNTSIQILTKELKNRDLATTVSGAIESLGYNAWDFITNFKTISEENSQLIADTFRFVDPKSIEKFAHQFYSSIGFATGDKDKLENAKEAYDYFRTYLDTLITVADTQTEVANNMQKAINRGLVDLDAEPIVIYPDGMDEYFSAVNETMDSNKVRLDKFTSDIEELLSKKDNNFLDFSSPELSASITQFKTGLDNAISWLESQGAAGTLRPEYSLLKGYITSLNEMITPEMDLSKAIIPTTTYGTNLLNLSAPYEMVLRAGMGLNFDSNKTTKSLYQKTLESIDESIKSFSKFLSPQTQVEMLQYYSDQKSLLQEQLLELEDLGLGDSERAKNIQSIIEGIEKDSHKISGELERSRKAKMARDHNLVNDVPTAWNSINGPAALENSVLGSLMDSFEDLFQSLKPIMMMIQNPVWTMAADIFKGFVEVISSAIDATIKPFFDALHWVGEVLGNSLLPIFDSLYPFMTLIAQIIETAIAPSLELLAPIIEIIAAVLDVIRPILVAVAVAFEVLMAPVKWLGDLFNWCGQWIATFGENLGIFVYNLGHMFNKKSYKSGPGGFKSDAFSGLQDRIDHILELNMDRDGVSDSISTGTAVQNATYQGGTHVTLNIYQQAPVVGEGGMLEFAMMVKDKLDEVDHYGL